MLSEARMGLQVSLLWTWGIPLSPNNDRTSSLKGTFEVGAKCLEEWGGGDQGLGGCTVCGTEVSHADARAGGLSCYAVACPKHKLIIVAEISECQAACRETCLCSQAREIKHVPVRCCKTFLAKAATRRSKSYSDMERWTRLSADVHSRCAQEWTQQTTLSSRCHDKPTSARSLGCPCGFRPGLRTELCSGRQ